MNSVIPQAVIVEALNRNTNSLIQEITSSTAPVSMAKQAVIRNLAEQVIRGVQLTLEGGWDISRANRGDALALQSYSPQLLRASITIRGFCDFRDAELIRTIKMITQATIALNKLQDPIPTAAVVAFPKDPACCSVQ